MIHFRNTASTPLSFSLGGRQYDVPVEGEVSIPRAFAYAVEGRRLPLEKTGESTVTTPAADPEGAPTDPVARLWFDRAHEMRRGLEGVEARHADALADLRDQMGAAATGHADEVALLQSELAAVRDRLTLGPEESILEALDMLLGAPPAPPAPPAPKAATAKPTAKS